MYEQDWLSSRNARHMLDHLISSYPESIYNYKYRLFAAACCEHWGINLEPASGKYLAVLWAKGWCRRPAEPGGVWDYKKGIYTPDIRSDLLRDIFGNPFQPPPQFSHHQNDAVRLNANVTSIAKTIYHEGRFQDMPILGDALEEAGCTNELILNHCRGMVQCSNCKGDRCVQDQRDYPCNPYCNNTGFIPAPIQCVRGCWLLDLIIGKENLPWNPKMSKPT